MHRIFENLIFITKSTQIFVLAVRCDHFGAILAVRFSINRAQSFPLITYLDSLPKLSQFLSQALSPSLSLSLGLSSSRKVEEDQKKHQGSSLSRG
jgi:hypothetical protein